MIRFVGRRQIYRAVEVMEGNGIVGVMWRNAEVNLLCVNSSRVKMQLIRFVGWKQIYRAVEVMGGNVEKH